MSRPRIGRGGNVVQSGVDHMPSGSRPKFRPQGGMYRGIVVRTYTTDDPARTQAPRENTTRVRSVECSVILSKSHAWLPKVPVLQRGHDVNNAHGIWIPKETTRSLDKGVLSLNALDTINPATLHGVLDGEQVAVQFVDNDPDSPVITHSFTHTEANRKVIDGSGWAESDGGDSRGTAEKEEYYLSHKGTEIRINEDGDILIDTVGAFKDRISEDPATGKGQVRFRVKDSEHFTVEVDGVDVLEVWKDGDQTVVDIGEGADEQLVRGNRAVDWLLAHDHPDAFGGTEAPNNPTIGGQPMDLNDALSPHGRVK